MVLVSDAVNLGIFVVSVLNGSVRFVGAKATVKVYIVIPQCLHLMDFEPLLMADLWSNKLSTVSSVDWWLRAGPSAPRCMMRGRKYG